MNEGNFFDNMESESIYFEHKGNAIKNNNNNKYENKERKALPYNSRKRTRTRCGKTSGAVDDHLPDTLTLTK